MSIDQAISVIAKEFEGQPISIRADGYWNATEMCKAYGRRFDNFLRLDSTKAYLKAFEEVQGNFLTSAQTLAEQEDEQTSSDLRKFSKAIQTKEGTLGGTWVHPQVALKLAAWLKPEFEVWVYGVIHKLLTQGEVKLKDELAGLKTALNQAQQTIEEYDIELALQKHEKDGWRKEYLHATGLKDDCDSYESDPECYQAVNA